MSKLKRLRRAAPASIEGAKPQLPAVSAGDGAVMISAGKYARNIVLGVFEQIGGQDAMAVWAQQNPTDFYTKMFAKTITREVEEKRVDTVEDLLDAIDVEAVDVEFEDV